MLFPSIGYKMIPNCGSIAGILPLWVMITKISINGFAPVDHHIRSSFTNPGTTANNYSKYIAYGYDIITNLTLNHEDSCIILNRGLTVSPNGLIGQQDQKAVLNSVTQLIVKPQSNNLLYHKNTNLWVCL